ncbi:MAG: amino acid adenylation domain-containing protein [Nitrospirales bacterium]
MSQEKEKIPYRLKINRGALVQPNQSKLLHQLLDEQVTLTPEAVAVVFEDQHLTYAALEARARHLASHLRMLDVQRGTLVGILAERSLEMVVALYASLKAGAAYVPIDPTYPDDRVTFMLQDAQVPVLLTQAHLCDRVSSYLGQLVLLGTEEERLYPRPASIPSGPQTGEDLAYMIYTSGSTGQPKGAMNTHRGICNRLLWMQAAYELQADDRVLQKTPFSFDVSVWEFFWPLLTGARLVMARPEGHRDRSYLRELIQREGITTLHFVPSMLQSFLQEPAVEGCGTVLRRVIASGEALSGDLQARFFSRMPTVELHNLYGPTEAAVDVTAWACRPEDGASTVPIGRPITNIYIRILDAAHQMVPIGVSGFLYIGGVGLARGYHGRPGLTAARFLPDPEAPSPGARVYHTGDLARYRTDGTLDYLGRVDHQVKIRGFRIECGEIAAILTRHPAVQEALVLCREDIPEDKRLVAYVMSTHTVKPTTTELLAWLKRSLPDYMLPSKFISLEAFPLTANGKIDRKALPSPDSKRPQLENLFDVPATLQEMNMARIWAQILGVTPVGIHDSFFELGGDSIRAIQVLALAQQQEMPCTLQQLYTGQTIHNLLRQLVRNQAIAPRAEHLSAPFALLSMDDRRRLPAGLENAYPLTSLQTGMFFHNEKNPASAIFHDIFSFRISFPFQQEALQSAVDLFIVRHPSMRTSFTLGSFSQPLQLVHPSARLAIEVEDLQHLDSVAQTKALDTWIEAEKKRPFDLTQPPLLRIKTQRYRTDEFQLIVSFHHAILDGWSLAMMLTEIFLDYSALLRGIHSSITPPAICYQTYVALEQAASQAEDSRKFWLEKLHDPELHLLPRWPSTYRTGGSDQVRGPEVLIPQDTFEGLKQVTFQAKTPFKSALLAAHFRVMNALYGHPDVISGMITNGRPEEMDGERMVGLFLNTVPLRLRLCGGTWLELVQQVFCAEGELIPHRRFPLAAIQRAQGRGTLSETAFDFVHFHIYRNLEGHKELGFLEGPYFEANNFVLFTTFMLDSTGTQLQMHIDYDPTHLCNEQIEAISGYYCRVLNAMASQPHARYDQFSPLGIAERQQQLVGWNKKTPSYFCDKGLHELFEEQVVRTPDAIAVQDNMHALSYAYLNQQANLVAHRLRTMGVGPDVPVAVCTARTADMLVALLAILKAGGAYVPLDPAYPSPWLAAVLEDTQAPVLLTQRQYLPHVSAKSLQVLLLDERDPASPDKTSQANPASMIHSEQLVYVLYTSGSTGNPKGVAITHRSALALMEWGKKEYPTEELAGVLASTSICFDLSVFEIFLPLSCGGTVILSENALTLPTLPAAPHVTLINSVPSVMQELLHAQRLPSSIRIVNLAGEPLRTSLVRRIYAESGIRKVYDLYGPSETTTYSTMALREAEGPETIGRPITHEQVYIVESTQQLLPVGVAGELMIGGAGLARGYYGRPALTAEKFVPNGLSPHPGTRLYRTGDQGRYRPDGRIEYLGRRDHQVKVRGFRIELGQIEARLHRHQEIAQAVVLCREDRPGDKTVVAYIVPANDSPLDLTTIRSYLMTQLPDYMIPGVFVSMKSIPLTHNGKVDRKALPVPAQGPRGSGRASEPPRTPLEEFIADIWRDLLQVERVSVHDNFFELGGHSLLATRLISRMQHQWQLDISLKDFFEKPTVAGLGETLSAARNETGRLPIPALQPVARSTPLPLSFNQQQLWLVEQLNPGNTAYILSYAWRVTGDLQVEILERSFNALIERHESLRMYVAEHEGEPRQAFLPQLSLTLPVVDLQMIPQSEQEEACQAHMRKAEAHPFDLQRGPLIRVLLYRLAPDDHMLILILHHIITDGWSMDILFTELRQVYEAFETEHSPALAPLPIQYADYAIWQRACLQGDILQSLLLYWTTRLADVPADFPLPTDHPRPAVQTFRGGNLTRELSPEMVRSLKAFCQTEGVTIFMTLLAVLQALLARHSGQEDIVVGTPVANRNRIELEGVVGIFLNTLVLRTDLSGAQTFRELLSRVREVCLGAYAHQELPFEKLVEALHPVRDLSHTPLFQVFFNLVDVTLRRLSLPGVTLQPITNHEETSAKFDLTLYAFLNEDRGWLCWNYNSDLFNHTTIVWLFDHYETLLQGLLSRPDVPISTVSIQEDRSRRSFHQTIPAVIPASSSFRPLEYPESTLSLAGRFEQIVAHDPHHLAVQTSEITWTYAELNRRANRVAHTLLSVLPDRSTSPPVGLLCSPGGPLLAGLLGVLKAGHPYVPLEPTLPLGRLESIAADATLTTILCCSATHEYVSALRDRGYQIIPLDEEHLMHEETNPQVPVSPDALAYILYTSGTTGAPKGVVQSHRNVLHHIGVYTNNLKIGPHDRLTQLASFSFDAAVMDIFGALLNGATLCPFDFHETGLEALSSWLAQQAISIYHSTPTVYRYWLKHAPTATIFPALRVVVLGGEEAARADFDAYHKHFGPECFFVNGLGPTESTVSLQWIASHATHLVGQTVPVGLPVQDTELILLDHAGQITEVYGEITLRSRHIALGYWQQPELTRCAFSGPPYPEGVRQYRTGDMGRYRPDGVLEFRGRKDNQIKLRGYRIELEEIENLLTRHSAVQNAVVLCQEDPPEEKYLAAYIVPAKESRLDPALLRKYLHTKLPDYMLPTAFVMLDALPLTLNGKINRRALPKPEQTHRVQPIGDVFPRTPLEELLAEIWSDLLKIDRISVHDHFFELGGHSLLATRLLAKLRENCQSDFPLRMLFDHPTLEDQALVIEEHLLKEIEQLSEHEVQQILDLEEFK